MTQPSNETIWRPACEAPILVNVNICGGPYVLGEYCSGNNLRMTVQAYKLQEPYVDSDGSVYTFKGDSDELFNPRYFCYIPEPCEEVMNDVDN